MGILGFINLFRKTSLFLMRCQGQILAMQLSFFLNKNKKYLKNPNLAIFAESDSKKEKLNAELKNILKRYKNDSSLILDYITNHNTKVYKLREAKLTLARFGEEPGLIPAYSGLKAFAINLILFKKIGLSTKPMFIVEDGEIDIYFLIHQFHKWYFMQNGISGYDERAQNLLKQINKGNTTIIDKLTPNDINSLKEAVSRDVESISFVEQYARETAGRKKALDKIKNGLGANI